MNWETLEAENATWSCAFNFAPFENDLRLHFHVESAIVAIPIFLNFAQLFSNPCKKAIDSILGRMESDRLGFWVFDEELEAWVLKFGLNLRCPLERNGGGGD